MEILRFLLGLVFCTGAVLILIGTIWDIFNRKSAAIFYFTLKSWPPLKKGSIIMSIGLALIVIVLFGILILKL